MKTASFFSALALALALSVSSVQAASDVYVITGVTTGEFLNMRANAGTGSSVVGRIPHNGQGIVTTGEEKKSVAPSGQKFTGTVSAAGSANVTYCRKTKQQTHHPRQRQHLLHHRRLLYHRSKFRLMSRHRQPRPPAIAWCAAALNLFGALKLPMPI